MTTMRKVVMISTYTLLSLLVAVVTIILVAYGKGYSFDFHSRHLTINGLLSLDSAPSGATLSIAGRVGTHTTPYHATLPVGQYDLTLTKAGYQTWHKRVAIVASTVTWVQYAWLLPLDLKPKVVLSAPDLTGLVSSPDHRHLAYLSGGTGAAVWTFDPNTGQSTKIYTPPATPAAPAATLQSVTWSSDATHLLVRGVMSDRTVYTIVPAGGGTAINVSAIYQVEAPDLRFSPTNWQQLYFTSSQGLRRLDVGAQTLSAVLADQVVGFSFASDRVLFVQTSALGKSLYALDRAGHKQLIVESLPESDGYELAFATYNGRDELAVLPQAAHSVTLYNQPFSNHPTGELVAKQADHVLFNGDGRFLTFWSAALISTYDREKSGPSTPVIYHFQLDRPLDYLEWFDNYHLLATTAGQVTTVEFDGGNPGGIASGLPGPIYSAFNQSALVYLHPAEGKVQLETLVVKR